MTEVYAIVYIIVIKPMIIMLIVWKLLTIGYDRAYLISNLGISTPIPHIAKIVIL